MVDRSTLVIGTRRSPLALAQAHEAQGRLALALGWGVERLPLAPIETTGDIIKDRPLSEAGGKGLFTRELDIALDDGRIDVAVHSSKDLPTVLPDGIVIAGFLPREDPRDAFISRRAPTLRDLPAGAVVGTASLRRQAMVRRLRPDLRTSLLRGNVATRLGRLERGEFDATILAMAGLRRLGMTEVVTAVLEPDEFLPAVGQGAIGITVRTGDAFAREAVGRVADVATGIAVSAERAFLAVLDGSCRTPIGGHAEVIGHAVRFRGLVLRPDGSDAIEVVREGPAAEAGRLGREAGLDVKGRLPAGFLDA